jgi:hypothetical protein
VSWLALGRAVLGLALDEWKARRAQARFANGPAQVTVTCVRCGAAVRADSAAMAAHWSGHSDAKQDRR